MDAMIKLLSSESFTEQLLLEDNGLPSTEIYPNLSEANYVKAEQAMQKAKNEWDDITALDIDRTQALNDLKKDWIDAGFDVSIGPFSESACKKLIQNQTVTLPNYFLDDYEAFVDIDNERLVAIEEATKIQKETDAVVEILLEEWREHPKYLENLSKFQKAVTYSYLGEDEDIEDANNLARSFIYVDISVLNDEEFAKDLLDRVKRSVPAYIE
jgi:hypothetical protein